MKTSVQIIDNYSIHGCDSPVRELTKKKYPDLFNEVLEHDKISKSSWYDLSKSAYEQYKKFRQMMFRKKYWLPFDGEKKPRLRKARWRTS